MSCGLTGGTRRYLGCIGAPAICPSHPQLPALRPCLPRSITVTFKDEKDGTEKTVKAPMGKTILEVRWVALQAWQFFGQHAMQHLAVVRAIPALFTAHSIAQQYAFTFLTSCQIAHENDVELEGACEGSLACSTCHVIVEDQVRLDARLLKLCSLQHMGQTCRLQRMDLRPVACSWGLHCSAGQQRRQPACWTLHVQHPMLMLS